MALLDRFRRPPQWKQDDPLARVAAVEELPLDQQDLLISIAHEDGDVRVRRAAVRKIIEPAAVAAVAQTDRDDSVREEAVGILRDLALGVFENTAEAESLAALALLTDVRDVIIVAESASLESVWRAAIARLEDPKALGTVARRASLPAARLEALQRIDDSSEVCAVAVKCEHKEVAVAAVERLTDREALKLVAAKAVAKPAARRARMLLDATVAEDRPPAADATAGEAAEARATRARRIDLCRLVESLARSAGSSVDLAARLQQAEAAWAQLTADAEPDLAQRFAIGCQAAADHAARMDADEADRRRVAQETAASVAARVSLCERVQAIAGDETPRRLDEARAAWHELPPMPLGQDAQAQALSRRFAEAVAACERRYASAIAGQALRQRAERVCQAAEDAAAARFPDAIHQWTAVARAWKDLLAAGQVAEDLGTRFSQAEERFRAREAAAREQQARQRLVNLERLRRLCARVDELLASPSPSLKDAERALRDLRGALDDMPLLPSKQDHDDALARMKGLHEALVPKVQELREIDEWQRWANAGIQEQLCRRAEALADVADAAEVARQLREIQEEWKKASLVPREKAQALWARFRAATDRARTRCNEYFAHQAEERAANLAGKEALCQQAEALADSTDWIRTAEAIKALQAAWKSVGPVPRGQEQAMWERFRRACDSFFTRRHEDLARRKEEWAANLTKKLALCERVETLASSSDWERGIEEIKRAQAEWKATGSVRKNRADAIWQRFRGACDAFFERYRERDNAKLAAERTERETLCAELEALASPAGAERAPEPADDPGDLVERVVSIRARWIALAQAEPSSRAARAPLQDRFSAALERVLEVYGERFANTPLDVEATRRTLVELCEKVERTLEALRPAPEMAVSPAAVLARQLREALAANTIGGRAAAAEAEEKWRTADRDVAQARASWQTLAPVPGDAGRALARRFELACHRFELQRDRQLRSGHPGDGRSAAPRNGTTPSRRPV
jgi:hypothetical protein